jgi:hypothetical protein
MEYRFVNGGTGFRAIERWRCGGSPDIIVIKDPANEKLLDAWSPLAIHGLGKFIRDDKQVVIWYAASKQLFVKMAP